MPKALFYAGVLSSAFIAFLAAVYAFAAFSPTAVLGGEGATGLALSRSAAAPYFFLAILAFAIPVAAIFLRMASLLAVRNLFTAFFALAALSCTLLTACLLAIGSLRLSVRAAEMADGHTTASLRPLVELHLANYYALGFFLSVLLLSIRPWFRIQASAMLSGVLTLPAVLFSWVIVEEHILAPVRTLSQAYSSAPSFAFFLIVAVIFLCLSIHCVAHQHYFIEVTNLRQLLDPLVDPGAENDRLPLRGGIAFGR